MCVWRVSHCISLHVAYCTTFWLLLTTVQFHGNKMVSWGLVPCSWVCCGGWGNNLLFTQNFIFGILISLQSKGDSRLLPCLKMFACLQFFIIGVCIRELLLLRKSAELPHKPGANCGPNKHWRQAARWRCHLFAEVASFVTVEGGRGRRKGRETKEEKF